jgi:hypothetical protein
MASVSSSNVAAIPRCPISGLDAEFVVPASQVLLERMTSNDQPRRRVGLESRTAEPRVEAAVVGLNAVIAYCPVWWKADGGSSAIRSVLKCSGLVGHHLVGLVGGR